MTERRSRGRPSTFDQALADAICETVEETGSIRAAALKHEISRGRIQSWEETHPEFHAAITRAKSVGYAARAEQAVADAKVAPDAAKGRLAFDAERWYLSKIDPRRYGDKVDVTTGGEKLPPSSVTVRFVRPDGDA